ncbi:MAG: hypothetical protein HYU67_00050 [Flavobacteriia bacterium]|nr:hypothetical protein [Flavobacteriia bacterium]
MKKLIYLALFLFAIVSCKKENKEVDLHLDYFPLDEGRFWEYDVTHYRYSITDQNLDTINYTLKVKVGDTVIDNQGRVAHKIYRYIYDTLNNEYDLKDVWTAIINDYKAEMVEENQRMIKLVFAPTEEKEWDINAYNIWDPMNAMYENIHDSYTINGFTFEKTVKVLHEYQEANMINYINKYEIYAKGVGMVEKTYIDIEFDNFDVEKPTGGEKLFYKLTNYGVE